jgi:hypothetical protein
MEHSNLNPAQKLVSRSPMRRMYRVDPQYINNQLTPYHAYKRIDRVNALTAHGRKFTLADRVESVSVAGQFTFLLDANNPGNAKVVDPSYGCAPVHAHRRVPTEKTLEGNV